MTDNLVKHNFICMHCLFGRI